MKAPDWVSSIPPGSWGQRTYHNKNLFLIQQEESGPVMIKGNQVTVDQHHRALTGEKVELRAFENDPVIFTVMLLLMVTQ